MIIICASFKETLFSFLYTFPMVERPRLVQDLHLRTLKQSKAQEQLTDEMAFVGEPGETVELGSVCTTQVGQEKVS